MTFIQEAVDGYLNNDADQYNRPAELVFFIKLGVIYEREGKAKAVEVFQKTFARIERQAKSIDAQGSGAPCENSDSIARGTCADGED